MPKRTNHKEHLLFTALRLFAKNGYASTPVSQIAKTAKVSQGLMYNFFKSKEDMLKEMMTLGFDDIHKSLNAYTQLKSPKEAIAVHVRATIATIKQNRELWKLLHSIRLQDKVAVAMQKKFRAIVNTIVSIFQKVFKQLRYAEPETEALLFLSQIDGMVIMFLQDNEIPIDQMGEQLIKRYTK